MTIELLRPAFWKVIELSFPSSHQLILTFGCLLITGFWLCILLFSICIHWPFYGTSFRGLVTSIHLRSQFPSGCVEEDQSFFDFLSNQNPSIGICCSAPQIFPKFVLASSQIQSLFSCSLLWDNLFYLQAVHWFFVCLQVQMPFLLTAVLSLQAHSPFF